MTKIVRRLHLGLAIVAVTPVFAAAQGFDAGKIRAGQTVLVRDLSGAETKGVVQSTDASKLVIKYGVGRLLDPSDPSRTLEDTRVFTPEEVDRVRRPGPIWDGAVKGALVALVPLGLIVGSCDCGGAPPEAYAVFMGIGAGIGLAFDAAFGPKTVYRNQGVARRVSLAPIIGKDRRGIAAAIRF